LYPGRRALRVDPTPASWPRPFQEDHVPTYAYACTACDHRFEIQQSFTDDAISICPQCQGPVRKLFNSVGIVFKGSGFYRTDSRSATGSTTSEKEPAAAASGTDTSSTAGSAGSTESTTSGSSTGGNPGSGGGPSSSTGSGSEGSGASKAGTKATANSAA
jgi:putative FmdB family regulatory protein